MKKREKIVREKREEKKKRVGLISGQNWFTTAQKNKNVLYYFVSWERLENSFVILLILFILQIWNFRKCWFLKIQGFKSLCYIWRFSLVNKIYVFFNLFFFNLKLKAYKRLFFFKCTISNMLMICLKFD